MTDLLADAAAQLETGDPHAARRASWLARSALEDRLDALLAARGLDVGDRASTRARLSCLEALYEDDAALVARTQYAWSRLSEACHQHAYQLSPTIGEVGALIATVAGLSVADD